jgi:hypothetical protein
VLTVSSRTETGIRRSPQAGMLTLNDAGLDFKLKRNDA